LLVVIGIIAVLVGILLPALQMARRQARSVVCLANMRSMLQGAAVYWNEYNGYFPGPNTSGAGLTAGGAYGGLPSSPCSNFDWASPSVGDSMNFPSDQLEKFETICTTDLRCPEVQLQYSELFQGPPLPHGNPVIFSYCTPTWFHLLPYAYGTKGNVEADDGNEAVLIPKTYAPRLNMVGDASSKLFLFEGARYWDAGEGNGLFLDYSTVTKTTGLSGSPQGSFDSRGPAFTTSASGEPYTMDATGKPTPLYIQVAGRHPGYRMTVGYFDGHAAQLTYIEARDISLWVPRGTTVQVPFNLYPEPYNKSYSFGESVN